jgi:hypothetical protein
LVVAAILGIDNEGLTLSIEWVDFVTLIVIETLVREILPGALHHHLLYLALNFSLLRVPDKVIMSKGGVMEQVNEDSSVRNKRAGYVGVWERLDAHRVVVKRWRDQIVEADLIGFNFLLSSSLFIESPKVE